MTFTNALDLKNTLSSKRSDRGLMMEIFIIPATHEDLIDYLKAWTTKFSDEDAKRFSNNDEYTIYWKEVK